MLKIVASGGTKDSNMTLKVHFIKYYKDRFEI